MPYSTIGMPHTGNSGFGSSAPSSPSRVDNPRTKQHGRGRSCTLPLQTVAGELVVLARCRVAPLDPPPISPPPTRVLADACPFDRANEVAAKSYSALGRRRHAARVRRLGRRRSRRRCRRVRPLAARAGRLADRTQPRRGQRVARRLRRRGAKAADAPRLRALDEPGNYLAPGVDERKTPMRSRGSSAADSSAPASRAATC